MSGRGRGGRGGASKSFNREQLAALGVTKNNDSVPNNQPDPLYPILERKPVPITSSLEFDYLLMLKQDFIDRLQLSSSYLKFPEANEGPEQEIDKLIAQLPKEKAKYDWRLFPTELKPKMSAKRYLKKTDGKNIDIKQTLSKLEAIESDGNKTNDATVKKELEEEEVEEGPEIDDEMDDCTDYVDNYFENGEFFDDDGDNLDEPIF